MLFTISNKLDFGVMFFSGYYSPNGSAHCKCTGIVKRGADNKELEGKSKTEMRKRVKKGLLASPPPAGFLNLAAPGESGLIGMQTHLLLSSSLSYPLLHTEDYAYREWESVLILR